MSSGGRSAVNTVDYGWAEMAVFLPRVWVISARWPAALELTPGRFRLFQVRGHHKDSPVSQPHPLHSDPCKKLNMSQHQDGTPQILESPPTEGIQDVELDRKIQAFRDVLSTAKHIVVLAGAGLSAGSGGYFITKNWMHHTA